MIRRLNIFGGPSSGKTTVAAAVFSALKKKGANIHLIPEHVKEWVYLDQKPESFDHLYLLGRQARREDTALRKKHVQLIITDGPLLHICGYCEWFSPAITPHLLGVAKEFEKTYPSLNIHLEGKLPYQREGRFESPERAARMSVFLADFYEKHVPDKFKFSITEEDKIIDLCLKTMG